MDMLKGNPILKATIMEVLDNQLRANNPPETRQTYDRLIREGNSVEETRRLIGCVIVSEIFNVMKKKEAFNEQRFVERLNQLPNTDFLGSEE